MVLEHCNKVLGMKINLRCEEILKLCTPFIEKAIKDCGIYQISRDFFALPFKDMNFAL